MAKTYVTFVELHKQNSGIQSFKTGMQVRYKKTNWKILTELPETYDENTYQDILIGTAFTYCPRCGYNLALNKDGYVACLSGCKKFVHYDNPVPVVSFLF